MKKVLFKCTHLIANPQEDIISPGAFLVEDGKVKDFGLFNNLKEKYLKKK